MIVSKLAGGLGNQMFQYAAGRCLAVKNNTEFGIDNSYFKDLDYSRGILQHRKHNIYSLDKFNTQKMFTTQSLPNVIEQKFDFDEDVYNIKQQNFCLTGYWQDERYFKDIAPIIKEEFQVTTPISNRNSEMLDRIKSTESVMVHIRGGDKRINNGKLHIMPDVEYYSNAMTHMFDYLHDPVFYVFTDDIDWVRKQYITDDYDDICFVDWNNDTTEACEDFRLMCACKHFITGASTFSWWAAWLAEKEDTIIFAPKRWEVANNREWKGLVPDRWTKFNINRKDNLKW